MIHSLTGKITYKDNKALILENQGIGYKVFCSSDTLKRVSEGQESKLLFVVDISGSRKLIAIGYFLFVVTSLQVFAEMIAVFLKILPDILPPYMWMVFASALAGFSLLWTISIWRFSRAPQGVLL